MDCGWFVVFSLWFVVCGLWLKRHHASFAFFESGAVGVAYAFCEVFRFFAKQSYLLRFMGVGSEGDGDVKLESRF